MILDAPEWLVVWLSTVNLWELILFAGAVTGAIVGAKQFVAKGWPALKSLATAVLNLAEYVESARELPEYMKRTDSLIGQIHHEVHFNNGGSVKDAVVRVERTSERLEEGIRGVHGRLDGVVTDIAELRSADAALREDIESTHQPHPKEQQ